MPANETAGTLGHPGSLFWSGGFLVVSATEPIPPDVAWPLERVPCADLHDPDPTLDIREV